ncbi:MAG TPA: hypothetical protein VMW27_05855 [Thermoanaerobaculia bacterium]|nr:hypothetical protein [Thermoanaerobaculia bacterium]
MAWIIATTLDKKHANLQTRLIVAILDRVAGSPAEGSVIMFSSGETLEVTESPAELLRSIDNEEHPENPSAQPNIW